MKTYVTLFFLMIVTNVSFSQQVEDYIESQTSTVPFQKLYLHTDRDFYFENDTIWFCAYHVDAQTHIKDLGFSNLYVDMINGDGVIILNELFAIGNGISSGYVPLEKSVVPEGKYMLRAYTQYLKKFGDDAIFSKSINISSIKNSFELEEEEESRATSEPLENNNPIRSNDEIDICFMPEGGYLLANENNCVAFTATDSLGKPVEIKGELWDGTGQCLIEFETIYKGAGKFCFIPEAGVKYSAKIKGIDQGIPLPVVQDSGAKIKILDHDSDYVRLVIQARKTKGLPYHYLVCIHRGRGLFYFKVDTRELNEVLELNALSFGIGINRLVLTDDKLNPVSERMLFSAANAINQLQVDVNKHTFSRREKVELELLPSIISEDSLRHVSISVVDENYINAEGVTQDIASYLLLDSELKGHIQNPKDYFVDNDTITKNAKLDLLMMTNGWSNYIWNGLNEETLDTNYEPDLGLTFKGNVKRAFGNKPPSGARVSMMVQKNDGSSSFYDQPVDSAGCFEFKNVVFADSARIVAQARNKRNSNNLSFEMHLQKHDPPVVTESTLRTLQSYSDIPYSLYRQRYLESMKLKEYYPEKDIIQIDEVEVRGWHYEPKIKTGVVRKDDGPYKLTTEETAFSIDIITYLAYDVPGLYLKYDEYGNTAVSVRTYLPPAVIVIDNFKILTQEEAREYPVDIFETIEIITPPRSYFLGIKAASGAILLTTRDNPPEISQNAPILGGIVERINGFTPLREFYSPKYSPENISSELPDYRQTLYWNPLVEIVNGFGEASFFTADNLGRYRVFIEGISENGKIFIGNAGFEVNE